MPSSIGPSLRVRPDFVPDGSTDPDRLRRLECVSEGGPLARVEQVDRFSAGEQRIAEHFDRVLQFVADGCHDLRIWLPGVHQNSQDPILASRRDRERETGMNTVTTCPLFHYTIPFVASISSVSLRNVAERRAASSTIARNERIARTHSWAACEIRSDGGSSHHATDECPGNHGRHGQESVRPPAQRFASRRVRPFRSNRFTESRRGLLWLIRIKPPGGSPVGST